MAAPRPTKPGFIGFLSWTCRGEGIGELAEVVPSGLSMISAIFLIFSGVVSAFSRPSLLLSSSSAYWPRPMDKLSRLLTLDVSADGATPPTADWWAATAVVAASAAPSDDVAAADVAVVAAAAVVVSFAYDVILSLGSV